MIRYGEVDFAAEVRALTQGRGVDVVYDAVGRTTFDGSLRCLRPRGMLVLYGQSSGPVPPFELRKLNDLGSLFITRPSLAHYTQDRAELELRAGEVLGGDRRGPPVGADRRALPARRGRRRAPRARRPRHHRQGVADPIGAYDDPTRARPRCSFCSPRRSRSAEPYAANSVLPKIELPDQHGAPRAIDETVARGDLHAAT